MYQCGDNDHLLLVILDKVNPKGYRAVTDPQVKEIVKAEVIKDKKAEQLIAKAKGVNSINAAKAKGATISEVAQITFAAPVFIPATGSKRTSSKWCCFCNCKG